MDNISKQDILFLIDVIEETLVNLVNGSLQYGIFPDELKVARVIPVYKSGQHCDCNNYRPISLPSTFLKILEKIIKTKLVTYINQNFKFDQFQYGFLEQITMDLGKNNYVVVVYFNMKKAFDTFNVGLSVYCIITILGLSIFLKKL